MNIERNMHPPPLASSIIEVIGRTPSELGLWADATQRDRIYRMRPINGFAAQSASAAVIMAAAVFGAPVSTTHVVSSAIAGVGSAERVKAVRWNMAFDIALAWIVTIPVSAGLAGAAYYLLRIGFHIFGRS